MSKKDKENISKKEKHTKKKIIIIIFSLLILLGISFAIYYLYFRKVEVNFSLLGEDNVELEVGNKYKEQGYKLIVDGKQINNNVNITNNINYKKLGIYEIKYTYMDKYKKKHQIKRVIKIVDKTPPEIKLTGSNELTILLNEEYKEPGYEVIDNYDKDLKDKVKVESNVDTKKEGEYLIKYIVSDSSNNTFEISRKIIVVKPKQVVVFREEKSNENTTNISSIVQNSSNTITQNKFNNNSIYLEGYIKDSNGSYIIRLKNGSNTYDFNMISINNNYYKGNLDLSNVPNGDYELYIVSNNEERLNNNMESIDRIVRAKVNNKLITFTYNNNQVNVNISDFQYQYDILIDPGHGGYDTGAVNKYIEEKVINLAVSMYEKCRYEEHGYKVFMIRTNDTYGVMLGDSTWRNLSKRSYAIGYYGAVSKVVYSNHHNSTTSNKTNGYEILTPAKYDSLNPELTIISRFNSLYPNLDGHRRVYARDYETGNMYTTSGGQQYNIKNYYATIRVPYELFNVKSITYEGYYMSNDNDHTWYWTNGNWKNVSEIKIEEYIKYLGGSYNPNTSCN